MIQERLALAPSYIPKALFYHILIRSIGCIKLTRYYFTQYTAFKICLLKKEKKLTKCHAFIMPFYEHFKYLYEYTQNTLKIKSCSDI